MLKKGSKLYSILTGVCPRCQNEKMFVSRNLYHPAFTLKMHQNCGHCDLKYNMEPSFFYGAMYVSYALGVAFSIVVFLVSFVWLNLSLKVAFLAIIGALFAFLPFIMRLSRNIWINLFVKYQPSKNKSA